MFPTQRRWQKFSCSSGNACDSESGSVGRAFRLFCSQKEGDSLDHLLHGRDLFCLLVIDLDIELTFELEEDIDAVEGIDAEFFEGAVGANGLQGNASGGGDNSEYAILHALWAFCLFGLGQFSSLLIPVALCAEKATPYAVVGATLPLSYPFSILTSCPFGYLILPSLED